MLKAKHERKWNIVENESMTSLKEYLKEKDMAEKEKGLEMVWQRENQTLYSDKIRNRVARKNTRKSGH